MQCPDSETSISFTSRLWRLAGLLFSLVLLALLLNALDLDALRRMTAGVPAASLLLALLVYLLLNFFRTLRFQVLLDAGAPALTALWPVVLVHNLMVRLMPFKTGEFAWLLLLRRHFDQSVGAGLGSLLGARLFELLIVLLIGGAALVQGSDRFDENRGALTLVLAGVFLLCLAGLVSAGWWLRQLRLRLPQRGNFSRRLAAALPALEDSLARLRQPRTFLFTLLLSCLTWSSSVCFNLVLLAALGIHGLPLLVGVISITMLVEALPVASISGLGVIEGGWTFGLVSLAGLEPGAAVATGFFLHACQLLAATLCGLVGWLWLRRLPRMEPAL
ncbi:MAG: flippase-like domain-containing protein [Anaerolineae bacterium]|nr:flippase-like domain-containing protein [Anaerolineae bacterium]